ISPTKGTSPRSAATPAPRERRHEAATKSDTAPGSASPVDKYSIRASAIVRRRTDDSIGILQRRTMRVRPTAELSAPQPRRTDFGSAAHAHQACAKVRQITTHASHVAGPGLLFWRPEGTRTDVRRLRARGVEESHRWKWHTSWREPAGKADDVRHESRHDAALAFEHAVDCGFCDFARGHLGDRNAELMGVGHVGPLGRYGPRAQHGAGHAGAVQLLVYCFGKGLYERLGCRVDGHAGYRLKSGDRGDVEHGARTTV